ncbi:MAG: hypothetical protein WCJ66_06135 [Verrucomicrobiota bacterium]
MVLVKDGDCAEGLLEARGGDGDGISNDGTRWASRSFSHGIIPGSPIKKGFDLAAASGIIRHAHP